MIRIENVVKKYHTREGMRTVLDNINLEISRGEKIGILGKNGAGKSTLIRLMGGIELPTSGHIYRNMKLSWPLAFSGGFQGSLTGIDNLKFICRVYGVDYRDRIDFIDDFSELGKYLREPLKRYSAGMRARLSFAISMAIEFDCYLIDEVVAVGDSRFHDKCRIELFEKRKERSLIIVSHDPGYIQEHCHYGCVLANGKLEKFNSTEEAYENYNR